MIKEDLLKEVVQNTSLTRREAAHVISLVLDSIKDALARGEKVTLVGFGTFSVKERKGRTGRNPRTGETLEIPPKKVVKFVPGKALKEAIK